MLGLHSYEVSPIIINGIILDFNFVRKSEALGGKTPAELALGQRSIINKDEGWFFLLNLAKHYERILNYKKRRGSNESSVQSSFDSFID